MAPVGSPAQVSFLQKVQKTKAIDPSALFDQVVKSKAFKQVGGRGCGGRLMDWMGSINAPPLPLP